MFLRQLPGRETAFPSSSFPRQRESVAKVMGRLYAVLNKDARTLGTVFMNATLLPYRLTWWLVFALMAAPLAGLVVLAFTGGLGANPIEFINRYLGDWALRALLVALAATPLKIVFGWTWPVRMRRMLGLWAFAYVTLHISNYVGVDQFFDWAAIGTDIIKRNYITVGMATYVILAALAATSPKAMIRRLGGKTWKRLHKFVYLAGALGCVHYFMMVKADTLPPLIHAGVLAALLGVRGWQRLRGRSRTTRA